MAEKQFTAEKPFTLGGRLAANSIPTPRRNLTIEQTVSSDGTPTLVCRGRITTETSVQFKSDVKSLASHHKSVLADLSEVDFVDSGGLGAVLGTYVSARSAGCDLKLINVHPHVKDLLDISRLASVLQA